MIRIRITIEETRRGWRWRRQQWDTVVNGGFYGTKLNEYSARRYATAADALEAVTQKERTEGGNG